MKKRISPDLFKNDSGESTQAGTLRQLAEGMLKIKPGKTGSKVRVEDSLRFFHELQVHMIELELQSVELLAVQKQFAIANEKYLKLYDYAPTGYLGISKMGEILELNITAANMLGKERESIMHSRFGFFITDETKPGFNSFLEKIFESKIKTSCEVTLSAVASTIVFVTLIGVISDSGKQCLINMVDNTILKHDKESLLSKQENLVAELLVANNELAFQNKEKGKRADELAIANIELLFQHGEKEKRAAELVIANTELTFQNEQKGMRADELISINRELSFSLDELNQFAYINNHDLQEPLRTLTYFTQLLHDDYGDKLDEDGHRYIEFIHNSAVRMSKMVRDLFEYSILGKESVRSLIDCNKVVNAVLLDLDDSIKASQAKITLEKLPTIVGFETELRLLFQNLIANAIKFHNKDVIPEIIISAGSSEKKWIFSIKDNGIGIDEKHNNKIFIIFQRLHNRDKFEGTGIGLAHCKKIVEMHGGKIWVESTPGSGSNFLFTIPILTI
ncbi:MAG: ATP-binding protein [Bacteroidota bacterium]